MTVHRNFSDTAKKNAILRNLQSNAGEFRCENCNLLLDPSKEQFHFDHIEPYARGGRSILSNCQVLCEKCNLAKNARELEAFQFEQKAMHLLELASKGPSDNFKKAPKKVYSMKTKPKNFQANVVREEQVLSREEIARGAVEQILAFVGEHGSIKKSDLNRRGNRLPTITYVKKKWGGIIPMKEALGIQSGLQKWSRVGVEQTLRKWVKKHGDLRQIDLTQKNRLPSLPCILKHLPELRSFNEIKDFIGLERVNIEWNKDKALIAGRHFVKNNGPCLGQRHLNRSNGLPTAKTVNRLFGSLENFQKKIGVSFYDRNKRKTIDDVEAGIKALFLKKKRVVKNKTDFYNKFRFSPGVISRLYGSTDLFFQKYSIIELEPKRASFLKTNIDELIIVFVKKYGRDIPKPKELKKYGLPSKDSIEKFYQTYRQPFIYFYQLYSKSK